jgi:pyruvate formate lyase activating enzyme
MITGNILHLQRMSTEDGPGIRTTVFFKGCPLHCAWCHNPESISSHIQTQWYESRCLKCLSCIAACPVDCLSMSSEGLQIDREICDGCGKCAEACPGGAMEMIGRAVSVEDLMGDLVKDRVYYQAATNGRDGNTGGVTLSGGEPTYQPDFAEALLRALKELGVSTALDTCGLASTHTFERLLPFVDLLLFDLKCSDPSLHSKFTGVSNVQILNNLKFIQNYRKQQAKPLELWIRTPLIPGATDSDENIRCIGRFLSETINGSISRWELCAFNNLCREQYQRLGLNWNYAQTPLMTKTDLARCEQTAKTTGVAPAIILATGATRVVD